MSTKERHASRATAWLKARIREIGSSSVDIYFQGVLAWCLAASADLLSNLQRDVQIECDDDVAAVLAPLVSALEDDASWARAVETTHWALVCRFSAVNWPDAYDDTIEVAKIALGPPPETADVLLLTANFQEDDDGDPDGLSGEGRFVFSMARHGYQAAVGEDPPIDVLHELTSWWMSAYDEASDFLVEHLTATFPDGPPPN